MGIRTALFLLAAALLVLVRPPAPAQGALIVPSGFEDRPVASGVFRPSALAFTPDGRLLIASTVGKVRVHEDGALLPAPALDLGTRVCANSERGLLGLAVDPEFASNHYVFAFYTFAKHGPGCDMNTPNTPVNRISRFVLGDDNVIDPASEVVLVDNIPSPDGRHNAGDLQFGKDGNLYASLGDGACDYAGNSGCLGLNDASRDQHVLLGKVVRITRDGDIPAGNPFTGADSARCNVMGITTPGLKCRETFAWGLRNPFRMGFDPNGAGTRFFINDVGESYWEEIDLGTSGADYGWNVREGPCARSSFTNCGPPPAGMTNPIHAYMHNGCSAATGAAFVPRGAWPALYDDAYLYGDFVCGKIFTLKPDGSGGYEAAEFATGIDPAAFIGMTFDPAADSQSLYYFTWAPAGHEVRRITYTGPANRAPAAHIEADPTFGPANLQVDFDATGSTDPDGDPLTFEWDFGDGTPHATAATLTHRYQVTGTYTATLTARDGRGGEDTATVRIDVGNTPPVPRIDAPSPTTTFSVGQQITLTGGATDAEDGTLPDSSLTWTVERHHDTHTHPYLPPTTGNDIEIVGPEPEDLSAASTSHLELILTATDSQGLSRSVTQDLLPHLVSLTFATDPPGLHVLVNEAELTGPQSVTSWEGWRITADAPGQTDAGGANWRFASWSDGGAATHQILTPASATTYTAQFAGAYARPKGATPLNVSLVPAFRACGGPNREHGPPLAEPACAPPARASPRLTVGTPDANGLPAQSTGALRLDAVLDDPGTPADESDVRVGASLTDVRRTSDLADYTGELGVLLGLRLTDRANGAAPNDAGTVTDTVLSFPVQCAGTADSIGAACSLATSVNSVVPGAVAQGLRSIWDIGAIELDDGGPDGIAATAGNDRFAVPGIFVP